MNKLLERLLNTDSDIYVVDMEMERIIHLMDKYKECSVKHITAKKRADAGRQTYGQVWQYSLNTNIRYPGDMRVREIEVNSNTKIWTIHYDPEEYYNTQDFNSRAQELRDNNWEVGEVEYE